MNRTPLFGLLLSSLLLPLGAIGQTQSDIRSSTPAERRAYLESLSDEERAAQIDAWRAERKGLSEEQREALREQKRAEWASLSDKEKQARRDKRRAEWESLSDEEKQARRAQHDEHKVARREHWQSMSEEERQRVRDRTGERPRHGQKLPRDDASEDQQSD